MSFVLDFWIQTPLAIHQKKYANSSILVISFWQKLYFYRFFTLLLHKPNFRYRLNKILKGALPNIYIYMLPWKLKVGVFIFFLNFAIKIKIKIFFFFFFFFKIKKNCLFYLYIRKLYYSVQYLASQCLLTCFFRANYLLWYLTAITNV